jgi:hypothetical protein
MYMLNDLDTPFPRLNSLLGTITFANQSTLRFATNMTKEDYIKAWSGVEIRQCWYRKSADDKTSVIAQIKFDK